MQLLKRRFAPFLICLVLMATGCAALRQAFSGPVRFSHEKMLHQSVECADCHAQAADGVKMGLPDLDTCLMCHEDVDKGKPHELTAPSFFENGQFKAAKVTAVPSEIIFSHQRHSVDAKVACTDCHQGIQKSTAVSKDLGLGMADCIACHAKSPVVRAKVAADDCARCHKEIRKDAPPASHRQNWTRLHGNKAKDGDQSALNDCSLCHTEDSCNSCHKTQKPENHNNQWRQRGHGVVASLDRDNCSTCHESDTCNSCHQTTAPRSHKGQWGGTKSRHCQSCHIPATADGCGLCHQQGTPSHAKADPTPASMIGTNCRTCHGVSPAAKLPHVDNGDDCNYCHR